MICLDNWADILLDDYEKMGHPTVSHTTLSTQEFNELCILSFGQGENREWADCLQAFIDGQGYPIIEVIPLTEEEYNQELWELFKLDPESTLSIKIPGMRKPVLLSKVS